MNYFINPASIYPRIISSMQFQIIK